MKELDAKKEFEKARQDRDAIQGRFGVVFQRGVPIQRGEPITTSNIGDIKEIDQRYEKALDGLNRAMDRLRRPAPPSP